MTDGDDETVLTTSIQARYLTQTLDILQTLVDESVIHLGKDGLHTKGMDPSTVAMHNPVELDAGAFDQTPSGSFATGVNLHKLSDYLSKADPDQIVDLAFKPQTRSLNIQYASVDVDVACIDPDAIRNVQDPDPELPNHFVADVEDVVDAIDIADMMSDFIDVSCNPDDDAVVLSARGDTDSANVTLDAADDLAQSHLVERTTSKFSLDYMVDVFGAVPSGGEVEVNVGEEFPVWLEYEYADGHGSVRTMVAPRISDE